ncbi:MAG: hypothetical protein Q7S92_01780 [Candidatus Diapherotrites archaeon]|nr:hypothetical protein [Candidatus Diapherotrites archaeon]
MKSIFLTQEIGSIQRPIWRQKLDAPVNENWIHEAIAWGERLNVEERFKLANAEKTGLLQKHGSERTIEEKQQIIEIASIYVIRMFETAGLDRVFNGEQPRTEMYDFLAKQTQGIETAGTLNSFDANYFTKGIVASPLAIQQSAIDFFAKEFNFVKKHSSKIVKPCLTGAYTMTDWSYIEYHRQQYEHKKEPALIALQKGRRDAVLDFSEYVLRPIVQNLAHQGATVIQIDEPAAATNEHEADLFVESVNQSFQGISSNIEKAVHLCYSNYSSLFPALTECSADSYLIEFTNHASPVHFKPNDVSPETYRALELFKEYKMDVSIGLGVIDIHSDAIETPEVIRDRLLYAEKLLGSPEKIQVNPDCGLRTRRWDIAFAKLCNMVKGTELARAEWS